MKLALKILVPLLGMIVVVHVQAAEMRDPTRPSGFQASTAGSDMALPRADGMRLQAIFFHPEHPGVLINGRRFSVGDEVGDGRIAAIHTDKIILTDASGEKELRLVTSSIKSREDSGQNPAVQEIEK